MNLCQLEDTLPNGFHDAELSGIDLDEASETATLRMRLLVSTPPDPPAPEVVLYKSASIHLRGLAVIDSPPQILHRSWPTTDVQGFVPNEDQWPKLAELDEEGRRNAYSFYIYDLNSSIHLVALDATLTWQE